MSVQVKELAFVFHPVKDLAAARKFYEQDLGLKVGVNVEFAPGQSWIEYDVAGQAVAISNAMPGSTSSALALEVVDLDAAHKSLKASGANISSEILEFTPCRMFQVKDPSGNEIMLHQRKAKT
jgi:predicted enzyme related to lactoylglutathione lyase